jgi:arylsulfatase A-like enzyme
MAGLSKNTIVVYTSDNGFFLGEHGLFNKMWMYEESMRLPLIIRFPGIAKPGSINKEMISILDFAPTFADFANAQIPSTLQGKSIRHLIEGKKPENLRKAIYYHYFNQFEVPEHEGIRTKEYKLIRFFDQKGDSFNELYHLSNDPGEMNNLYLSPKYKTIKNRLEKSLDKMKKLACVLQK